MKETKITFTGDVMLKSEMIDCYKNGENSYNFDDIFASIKPFLQESDYVVGNLETPISEERADYKHESYRFTSPIEFAQAVKNAGFHFVSTANNHCLDNGLDGVRKTVDALDKVGLVHSGIFYQTKKPCIVEINGMKIAFLAYTYGTNAFNNNVYLDDSVHVNLFQAQELNNPVIRYLYQNKSLPIKVIRYIMRKCHLFQFHKQPYIRYEKDVIQKKELLDDIKEAKQNADHIIMCMHEGGQYNLDPIERSEDTIDFLLKNGVNIIIGNHEHRVQKTDVSGNNVVTYCLGNFDGLGGVLLPPYDKMGDYSILFHLYLTKERVTKVSFSVLKTVPDLNHKKFGVKVELLVDLLEKEQDESLKEQYLEDNQKIVEIVTGKKIEKDEVQKEYVIKDFGIGLS